MAKDRIVMLIKIKRKPEPSLQEISMFKNEPNLYEQKLSRDLKKSQAKARAKKRK